MPRISLETLVELLGLALEVAAMILLSAVGVFAEWAGFTSLATGFEPVTIWLIGVGTVALYASVYMLGYRRLLPRLLAGIDARQI